MILRACGDHMLIMKGIYREGISYHQIWVSVYKLPRKLINTDKLRRGDSEEGTSSTKLVIFLILINLVSRLKISLYQKVDPSIRYSTLINM